MYFLYLVFIIMQLKADKFDKIFLSVSFLKSNIKTLYTYFYYDLI